MSRHLPKLLFFALIVRPLILFFMGLLVYRREALPTHGPCIIAANHNSHLDTLVLMSLFPLRDLPRVRPVAAADYFLANRFFAWFSLQVIGIVPIARNSRQSREQLLSPCLNALRQGDILILYPEGTRGEPEILGALKKGIYHLARAEGGCPVVPVYLYGAGKALPRGEALLVPFNIKVAVGDSMRMEGSTQENIASLEQQFLLLQAVCHPEEHG